MRPLSAGAALLVLTLAAYVPAMRGGFVWDDDALLTDNRNIRSLEGLGRSWIDPRANLDYYPLTYTSWWLEYRLWGLWPAGYHADNVLLHAAVAVLAWRILRRLAVPGAWLAAAVFAVHPLNVQSVAWVAERKNVLSGVFALLAAWCFVRSVEAADEGGGRRGASFYGLSLAAYAAAMLAKPMTMALAAALPLLAWWKRGRPTWRDAAAAAAYLALAAPMAAVTIWVQYRHVGASGEAFGYAPAERVLIAGRALWFYAGKLAWPQDLCFVYPKWQVDAGDWRQYLFPAGAAGVVAALALARRRLGPGPLVGVLFFVVMLSPALGFVNVYWYAYYYVASHMPYLAALGLVAVGAGAAARAAARMPPWGRRAAAVAAAGVLTILAAISWHGGGAYEDAETLWRHTLASNPDAWIAHNNLGNILQDRGEADQALAHYRETLRLAPDFAPAHANLAVILIGKDRLDEAAYHCREALRVRPDLTRARTNLGSILAAQGRAEDAIGEFLAALRADPSDLPAMGNLAEVLRIVGRSDEAAHWYRACADAARRQGRQDMAARCEERLADLRRSPAGAPAATPAPGGGRPPGGGP